jgi:L-2,4-diaminobutyrate transaminase
MASLTSSCDVPLSASIVRERVYQVMEEGADRIGAFSHGYTYSGHPIGVAAAVLDIVERETLVGAAAATGAYLQSRLRETFAGMPIVGEVRGVSMLAACGKHYLESPQALARRDGAAEFLGFEIWIAKNERHRHIVPDQIAAVVCEL